MRNKKKKKKSQKIQEKKTLFNPLRGLEQFKTVSDTLSIRNEQRNGQSNSTQFNPLTLNFTVYCTPYRYTD